MEDGELLVRSHYRVCREYCSPEAERRHELNRRKQLAFQNDLNTEWIYEVRPLRDIIISSIALSLDPSTKSLPKSFNCLPSDLRDRLRPACKAPVDCRIHPCSLTPMKIDTSGGWRCDAWRLPSGCLRDLKAFKLTQNIRRWSCEQCDFDLCDKCTRKYLRISSQRIPRPAGATNLTVGIFTIPAYQSALHRPAPHIFCVPLLRQAAQVYSFLEKTAPMTELDNVVSLGYIIYSRYLLFVYLLRDHLKKSKAVLIPPIDVEVIWFTHMLQSDTYALFAQKYGIAGVSHPWTLLISGEARIAARLRAAELWAKFCPAESYEASPTKRSAWSAPEPEASLLISPDKVMLDRTWFGELRKSCQGINVRSVAFLHRSLLGYQRFLYLLAKFPKTLQRIGFSPSPPIDLFWHTHLLQPSAYTYDSERLIFNVHHHRLLSNASQRTVQSRVSYTLQTYLESSAENSVWKAEFNESYAAYIQRLPTRATVLHDCPMSFLVADGSDWRCDAWKTPRGCVRGLSEFGKAAGVDRWSCEACDFDLCDACFARGL